MAQDSSRKDPPRNAPEVRQLSTTSVAPRERYEFWRSQFAALVDIQRPRSETRVPFEAELTQYVGGRDVHFNAFHADASVNRFCADTSDGSFFVTHVLTGRMEVSDRRGSSHVTDGGLFLLDPSRAVTTRNSRYTFCHLRLPRSLVLDAIGVDPLSAASASLLRLDADGLAPFLSSQLQVFFTHAPRLAPDERAAAMDAMVDLTLALFRARVRSRSDDREVLDQGLFRAATAFIERHAHRAELTPERVARAIGCSRARLYRVCATREVGVFELIRETRLRMCRDRLAANPSEPVGTIAFECGFPDPPTFNRVFKRRFGMSPTEWRARNVRPTR